MKKCCFALLSALAVFTLGAASGPAYQLFINGKESKTAVVQTKDGVLVPLTLPANAETETWTVSLSRDEVNHKVDVKLTQVKPKVRGEADCYWCSASGKCAQDYPAGSGVDYRGDSEGNCNGTGTCPHCNGTKKI